MPMLLALLHQQELVDLRVLHITRSICGTETCEVYAACLVRGIPGDGVVACFPGTGCEFGYLTAKNVVDDEGDGACLGEIELDLC